MVMLYTELEHKIVKGEINIETDCVWISDYRLGTDPTSKPIRHVKPTKVKTFKATGGCIKLTKNKKVYYSNYHFRTLNKNGTISSKIIAPYDNTGFRSYTGVSLNIFMTEEECREHYLSLCESVKNALEEYKDIYMKTFDVLINEADELINEYK